MRGEVGNSGRGLMCIPAIHRAHGGVAPRECNLISGTKRASAVLTII